VILDALIDVKTREIAFSPGFRWGTTLLPGQTITRESTDGPDGDHVSAHDADEMSGATIKTVLEDVADNLFNPDPYYQQGGDMVRVGGMRTRSTRRRRPAPHRAHGTRRAADRRRRRRYKVAGWAPVAEGASGEPIWDVVAKWLRDRKTVSARRLNLPKLVGVEGNPGIG
jgi:sulfur-oxidizing protein SoxB